MILMLIISYRFSENKIVKQVETAFRAKEEKQYRMEESLMFLRLI